MSIYFDSISHALGIRPIKELCPDFDHDDVYPLYNPTLSTHGEFNAFYGKKHTIETKKQLKESWSKNSKRKENLIEFNKSMAIKKRGKLPKQLYVLDKCVYCSIEATQSNITKWHNENCKMNPENKENEIGSFEYIECPHCNFRPNTSKANSRRNFKVYHLDNCKRLMNEQANSSN